MPVPDPNAPQLTPEQERRFAEIVVPSPREVKFDLTPYSAYHGWRRWLMKARGWFRG